MAENEQETQPSQGTQLLLLSGNDLWCNLAESWKLGNNWHKQVAWSYGFAILVVTFTHISKLIRSVTQGLQHTLILLLDLTCSFYPSPFPRSILYAFFPYLTSATYPAHLNPLQCNNTR
jgi:hypothetical protein